MSEPEVKTKNHDEIYDLSNKIARSVIAVIDTLTQRGAWKGEELSTIGGLREQSIYVVKLVEAYHSDNNAS